MSCGILMPKYVITALLHILYSTRTWHGVGVIMLKNSSFMFTLLFIIPRTVLLSSIQPEAESLDFSTTALPRNL